MRRPTDTPKTSRYLLLVAICIVVAALYFAREVLIPVALAMLLSFLLAPLVNRLERWKLGRVPSVLILTASLFTIMGVLGYIVATQLYDLANNIDHYKENIVAKVEGFSVRGGLIEKFQKTATEVQQRIEDAEKPATTQATQPTEKAADLLATEAAARARDPRATIEPPPATAPTTNVAAAWTAEHPLPVGVVAPKASPVQTLGRYLGLVLGPLGTAGIVIVFVIFMLLQREDLRDRLIRLIAGGQLTVATQALDDASSRISRYLLAQAIVNGTYGVAISIGLWIIGATVGRNDSSGTTEFPNVVLWGLMCALLRFIPYIGPWIAAAFPLLLSLAVYKTMHVFVWTTMMFVVIELLSNNFMEPWLYGSSTGMSTIAVLVSAVFWTWLWGPVGLLLATPLTTVLVVLGKYVPPLRFLDVLLGDEPVLDPPTRVYQRLLALDAEEATDTLQEYRKEMPLEEVYDKVLLPALALSEQDRTRGMLDDRRQEFIRRAMRDIIEEMGDQERVRVEKQATDTVVRDAKGEGNGEATDDGASRAAPTNDSSRLKSVPRDCKINIVCLPAHDEADEIVDLMLVQLLELRGYCAYSASQASLASEMIDQVESRHADVVVVSALPPGAVNHARYLCKRVHARYPDAKMAVGLWAYNGNIARAKERITCVASVALVTTLAEMQDQIDQLAQSALVREVPATVEQ